MQDVLFLGNGINRAFNGDSWDNLIKMISTKYESSLTADDVEHLPFPMKVVALSGDRVIATVKHNTFRSFVPSEYNYYIATGTVDEMRESFDNLR